VESGKQGICELLDFPGRHLSALGEIKRVEGEQIDDGDARAFEGWDDVGVWREIKVWQNRQDVAHEEGGRMKRPFIVFEGADSRE
jgi:hypothetical protein